MSGTLIDPPDSARLDWTSTSHVTAVVAALEQARPDAVRFVGGCVRDGLAGLAPADIDIATVLRPDAVVEALKSAGLGAALTGVEHGTITAIADHKGVEVTTLRADVSTDGRRATVAFTEDWATDARRRDFTINAMYLTPDRRLYDPVGGREDLASGRVRFIGDAAARIREDYLRILRFFRFSARFARDEFDAVGLAACAAHRSGLAKLSAERLGAELKSLLSLPAPAHALTAMRDAGVLAEIWRHEANIDAAARAKELDAAAPPPVMFAALWRENGNGLKAALRLANDEEKRRSQAVRFAPLYAMLANESEAKALLYRIGPRAFADASLVARAAGRVGNRAIDDLGARWRAPEFPVGGNDVAALGVAKGPAFTQLLASVEARWIAEGFPPRKRALALLAEEAQK